METLRIYIIGAMILFMFSIILVLILNTESTTENGKSKTKKRRIKADHRRTIQFVVAWLFPPTIIILFILKFDIKILGTLLGTFMGYVLAGVGKENN